MCAYARTTVTANPKPYERDCLCAHDLAHAHRLGLPQVSGLRYKVATTAVPVHAVAHPRWWLPPKPQAASRSRGCARDLAPPFCCYLLLATGPAHRQLWPLGPTGEYLPAIYPVQGTCRNTRHDRPCIPCIACIACILAAPLLPTRSRMRASPPACPRKRAPHAQPCAASFV